MKKGFTLVELLAVFIILAILALVTVIAVRTVINDTGDSLSDTQIKEIEKAAKEYYIQEGMDSGTTCISVTRLRTKGYIEGTKVVDPKTRKEITGSVRITYSANQYFFTYQASDCE